MTEEKGQFTTVDGVVITKENTNSVKGIVLALFGALLWGISGIFAQFLLQERGINIEWLIAVRMLLAGVMLLLFSAKKDKKGTFAIWKNKKSAFNLIGFGLIGMVLVQYTYFAAIKLSNVATASVLQYLGPVLIAVYLSLKNRKLPATTEMLAIAFAVVGTFLLVTHGDVNSLVISTDALLMGLAAAVALAIYSIQPVKLLQNYNAMVVAGWGMLIGGIGFSFLKSPFEVEGTWDMYSFLALFYIIIFGTLIAFYAYLSAVKIIGAQKSSVLSSAEPLSATVLSILWLNVSFGLVDWIGSLFIVSTVFILSKLGK